MQNQAIQLIECKNILALQFRFKKLEKKEIYQKSRKLAICMWLSGALIVMNTQLAYQNFSVG